MLAYHVQTSVLWLIWIGCNVGDNLYQQTVRLWIKRLNKTLSLLLKHLHHTKKFSSFQQWQLLEWRKFGILFLHDALPCLAIRRTLKAFDRVSTVSEKQMRTQKCQAKRNGAKENKSDNVSKDLLLMHYRVNT